VTKVKSNKNLQVPKILLGIIITLILGGLLNSSMWIFKPYSFWLDELYSVTAASENIKSLHSILIGDVHPPLYQIFLKLWMLIFGDSELSTRSLSLVFAISASAYIYSKKKYGNLFCLIVLLFFNTNWLYAFYANEARSYSMMLFFATLLAINLPAKNEKPSLVFYVSSILLSLTHYFGLLMTGVTLALYILTNLKRLKLIFPIFIVGILCLLWPIYHMIVGEILSKSNGNFWIQTGGIFDSFRIAAQGYLPKTEYIGGVLLIVGLFFSIAITKIKSKPINTAFLTLTHTASIISLIFLILIALIDKWSSMSTVRNYIVLLPFLSISIAGTTVYLINKYKEFGKICLAMLLLYCSLSLKISFNEISNKSVGQQDWRGASLFIKNNHDGKNIYYLGSETNKWQYLVSNFYLKKFSNSKLQAKPLYDNIDETKLNKPFMLLFGPLGGSDADKLKKEMNALGAVQSYKRGIPIDLVEGQIGVFVKN